MPWYQNKGEIKAYRPIFLHRSSYRLLLNCHTVLSPALTTGGFLGRWRLLAVDFLLGLGQETSLLRFLALWPIFVQQLDHLTSSRSHVMLSSVIKSVSRYVYV